MRRLRATVPVLAIALAALPHVAAAQDGPAASFASDRAIRVVVDSTTIVVTFTGAGTARLDAATPAGAFAVSTDSVTLRTWALAATQLEAPGRDERGEPLYRGVGLSDPSTGTSAALARLTSSIQGDYQLSLAEGERRQVVRLGYPQWEALYLALLGEDTRAGELGPLYYEFQVTTPVVPQRGNRDPEYPEALRQARREGRVVAQWVVDPTGRPRVETLKVLESADPEFTAAVRRALWDWRFTPAQLEGRAVSQLVQQVFDFNLR